MNLRKSHFAWKTKSLGFALPMLAAIALAGCGGGGDSNPPVISNQSVTTTPATLTYQGGTAHVTATVTDATGVDPSTVKVNVLVGGSSVSGGPVVMTPTATAGVYTYSMPLANNITGTSAVTYTFVLTASDLQGHAMLNSVTAGSATVPAPPGPPGSP